MGVLLGEVYRPEDIPSMRESQVRDLTPSALSPSSPTINLATIMREIEGMKKDIAQIKQVLQSHGIAVK